MFAKAVKLDILHHHHFVVAHAEHRTIQELLGILAVAASQITQRLFEAFGSAAESFARGIFSELDDHRPHQVRDFPAIVRGGNHYSLTVSHFYFTHRFSLHGAGCSAPSESPSYSKLFLLVSS